MTHVVLVHGAWAGGWVWDTVVEPLRAAGLQPHVVDLPGVGVDDGGIDDDRVDDVGCDDDEAVTIDTLAGHVVALVEQLDGPVVLVGHSGAGVIVTQVAELVPDRVAGVAYVAAMMLPSGMDYGALCAGLGMPADVGITRWLEWTDDGRYSRVPPEAGAAVFFHDAPTAESAIAAARALRPQQETARLIAARWTAERFGRLPRLYIEATADRTVLLEAQRAMQDLVPGARVVTLATGHAPQLAAPELLCDALIDFARGVR